MYHIEKIDVTSTEHPLFTAFSSGFYAGDPLYAPAPVGVLQTMPSCGFLIRERDRVVGRVAAMINPALRCEGTVPGLVGFFECIDNQECATMLFEAALSWLRAQGCTHCIGPINGSTWQSYRISEESSYPPFFLDNYHKPWYSKLLRGAGFEPLSTYSSTISPTGLSTQQRTERFKHHFFNRGIIERGIDINNFDNDIKSIYELSVHAFASNFLFTPLEWEQFLLMYQKARAIADPDLIRLCVDRQGNCLAFIFCVPDLFNNYDKTLIIKTVAAMPDSRARGLGTFLVERIHQEAYSRGYRSVIHALMHDKNVSTLIGNQHSTVIRRYTLFIRNILHPNKFCTHNKKPQDA